jgi:hypothetical protein
MRNSNAGSWKDTLWFREAAESVFIRVFARVSATLAISCFRWPYGQLPSLWDGTDPLLGGHRAAPGRSHAVVGLDQEVDREHN